MPHSIRRDPVQRQAARREFADLLNAHLNRGQHPELRPAHWKAWTNSNFASAVDASPNSVANWRNRETPIPPADIIPILEALFGEKPEFSNHRRELKEAWERARGLVPADGEEFHDDWETIESVVYTALAEAILHQPTPANGAERFYLNGTLRFGLVEHNDRDRAITVGLRDAFLSITGSGYQISQNSMLGERARHSHITPGVGGFTIVGPYKDGRLNGNPVGEDYLAAIEPGLKGKNVVTITLCAGPRAFIFAYVDDPYKLPSTPQQKPNREAILNILFGSTMQRDPQGRTILATVSLRRKPQK
jgi:hypothetical protein